MCSEGLAAWMGLVAPCLSPSFSFALLLPASHSPSYSTSFPFCFSFSLSLLHLHPAPLLLGCLSCACLPAVPSIRYRGPICSDQGKLVALGAHADATCAPGPLFDASWPASGQRQVGGFPATLCISASGYLDTVCPWCPDWKRNASVLSYTCLAQPLACDA